MNISRKPGKLYFEKYAIYTLIECYDGALSSMIQNSKQESPDFQSKEIDLGIEVTEAICLNKYTDRKMLFYDSDISINEFNDSLSRIEKRIIVKTEKLNRLYKKFNENWLYIFSHNALITIEDVRAVINKFSYDSRVDYDKIFIDCIDKVYVIEKLQYVSIIAVDYRIQNMIKKRLIKELY